MQRAHHLPIRLRLVAYFAAAMALLLTLMSWFVFWRVRISLDHRLNQDLATALADVSEARDVQFYDAGGNVLRSGPGVRTGRRLLTRAEARRAAQMPVRAHRGNLLSHHGALRIRARPVRGAGAAAAVAVAVRVDQRDEALRELLAQLAIGNALALVVASGIAYRVTKAALDPVERYRTEAERITHGTPGVRLSVPESPRDELARLGDTLNEMIDALERAAQRQRDFIDDASHELRTPLTTLAAEIAVTLRKQRSPEEYEAALRRLERTTAELLELTESLLALGAIGSTSTSAAHVPASELLDVSARRAREQLGEGGRAVRTSGDGLLVRGDRVMLERALGNITDNAVRHGAGDLSLRARRYDPAHVALEVHDEGHIEPVFLAHAAERFRQAEHSRGGTGVGLGLSLVEAIVVAHGGQLRVCSNGAHHPEGSCLHDESGTTISLILPS